jgi:hypothetical protein
MGNGYPLPSLHLLAAAATVIGRASLHLKLSGHGGRLRGLLLKVHPKFSRQVQSLHGYAPIGAIRGETFVYAHQSLLHYPNCLSLSGSSGGPRIWEKSGLISDIDFLGKEIVKRINTDWLYGMWYVVHKIRGQAVLEVGIHDLHVKNRALPGKWLLIKLLSEEGI